MRDVVKNSACCIGEVGLYQHSRGEIWNTSSSSSSSTKDVLDLALADVLDLDAEIGSEASNEGIHQIRS